MVIQYIRNKEKLTINLPVGSGNKKLISKIHFTPNSTYAFSDEEGEKLLSLDKYNFRRVNGKEKEEEETSVLEPKKRGRPKRVNDYIDNI